MAIAILTKSKNIVPLLIVNRLYPFKFHRYISLNADAD